MPLSLRHVQRGERRRWRHTIGAQRQRISDDELLHPSSKARSEAEEPSDRHNETELIQPQDSDAGDVRTKPFGYFGYQGWTEMTK